MTARAPTAVPVPDVRALGLRLIDRPFGTVVLTKSGLNEERWRRALTQWLATPEGRTWRAGAGL